MAITENTFTVEELIAAIGVRPELQTTLQTFLTGEGFVVKTKTDFQKDVSTGIAGEVSKIAGRMESDILEQFKDLGTKKEHSDEKYYDLFKRGAKAAKDKIAELQTTLSDLQKKVADGKGNEELANQLQVIKAQAAEFEKQVKDYRENVVPAYEKRFVDIKIGSVIDAARNGIGWRKDIPQSMLNNALDFERDALLKSAKHVNGTLTFYDANNSPLLDDKGNVATADWLIRKKFADSIEKEKESGAGSKTPTGHKHPATGQDILIPAGLKNQQELIKYLTVDLALSQTSKEVIEITKASKLPLF